MSGYIQRREFIGGLAGSAVLGSAAAAGVSQLTPSGHLRAAMDIGRSVVRCGVVEPTPGQLRAVLRIGSVPAETLFDTRWSPEIRDDFASGATVYVDGWTLSATEARLCALLALEIDGGPV